MLDNEQKKERPQLGLAIPVTNKAKPSSYDLKGSIMIDGKSYRFGAYKSKAKGGGKLQEGQDPYDESNYKVFNQKYKSNSKSNLVDYDLPRKRLINVLNKNNVNYLDMLPFMLAENSANDPVAFSDGHINKKGHGIFAKKIQEYFLKKGWLNE